MARSGSFNTSGYSASDGSIYLTFSWSVVSQSVEDNTTTIKWELKGAGTSGQWFQTGEVKVIIEGVTVYTFTGKTFRLMSGDLVASGTRTFTHNTDGSRSFSASATAGIFYYTSDNAKGSGSWSIDTIPRASQPSLVTWPDTTQNVGDFGVDFSIHMNRKSDVFTHTVRYEYGSRKGTIATGVTTGTTWAVPLAFMNDIPNATSGSGRIYVDTYNGSTLVGTKYTGFTATVPASAKPSCSLTLKDTTGIDAIYGSPVQGLSKIQVTVNTTLAYSSPIASGTINADGVNYSGLSATTGVLQTSGSSKVTATVKDARGRSGSASYTMSVQAYKAPQISSLTVHRSDADGTTNDQGTHIRVLFSAAISSMSSKNTARYVLRYKKSAASSWTEVAISALDNVFTVTNREYIFPADESSSYDVEVVATDRHSSASRATSASTAFSLMDWHPSGTGLRFGGVAERENALQNDLALVQIANSFTSYTDGTGGADGYIRVAEITITGAYVNYPIVFELLQRGANLPMKVHVLFMNNGASQPGLQTIWYEGANYEAYLSETSASVWGLYVKKSQTWDRITVSKWYTDGGLSNVSVIFPGDQVSSVPTGLKGYYRATPAILRNILDAFMPVGFVLTLYSHADPNTMYPGTTWVRITNGFLWAVDSSGTIGLTGGAKEVTLTTDQIPSHSHGSVYSQHAAGTKSQAWYTTAGTALAYGTVATGGGQAHNNMPPYVQVSIWRRTA